MLKILDTMPIWRHIIIIISKSHQNPIILSIFSDFFTKNVSFDPIQAKIFFALKGQFRMICHFQITLRDYLDLIIHPATEPNVPDFQLHQNLIIIISKSHQNLIV